MAQHDELIGELQAPGQWLKSLPTDRSIAQSVPSDAPFRAAAALTDLQAQEERDAARYVELRSAFAKVVSENVDLQAQVAGLREALRGYTEDQECNECERLVSSGNTARQALTQWTGKGRDDGTA